MFNSTITRRAMTLLAGILATSSIALTASPAHAYVAGCDGPGHPKYKISNVSYVRKATNLKSDYLAGPGTITYTKTTTAEVNASMSGEVTAEESVVLASASQTIGVSLGASWSKSGSWSYSKPVPAGKVARLVMFHESRKFLVTKYYLDHDCNVHTIYADYVTAPRTASINVWDLQYA